MDLALNNLQALICHKTKTHSHTHTHTHTHTNTHIHTRTGCESMSIS